MSAETDPQRDVYYQYTRSRRLAREVGELDEEIDLWYGAKSILVPPYYGSQSADFEAAYEEFQELEAILDYLEALADDDEVSSDINMQAEEFARKMSSHVIIANVISRLDPEILSSSYIESEFGPSQGYTRSFLVDMQRILTGIDSLNQQNPARVRRTMYNRCSFIQDWYYESVDLSKEDVPDIKDCLDWGREQKNSVENLFNGVVGVRRNIADALDKKISDVIQEKDSKEKELIDIENKISEIQREIDSGTVISKSAIRIIGYALIAWVVVVITTAVSITGGPHFCGKKPEKAPNENRVLLEAMTVFILTAAILILGIASKISSEVLGTLIGGISGYVLGKFKEAASGDRDGGNSTAPDSPGSAVSAPPAEPAD
ncbi:MAG: hypothetical protein AAFR65_09820 [Pseudomonadota bacterium]